MELKDFPMLEHLNETQQQNFESACHYEDFPDGTRIITQDKRGDRLYLLLDGQVKVRVRLDGFEGDVADIEAPAVFGEMELLSGIPRNASVYANGPVRCASIDFDTLRARIDDADPASLKFVVRVAQVMAKRLGAVSRKLVELEQRLGPRGAADLKAFQAKVFSEWDLDD